MSFSNNVRFRVGTPSRRINLNGRPLFRMQFKELIYVLGLDMDFYISLVLFCVDDIQMCHIHRGGGSTSYLKSQSILVINIHHELCDRWSSSGETCFTGFKLVVYSVSSVTSSLWL